MSDIYINEATGKKIKVYQVTDVHVWDDEIDFRDTADGVAVGSIGYTGKKRYVRIVATGTTNTDAAVSVHAIKERAMVSPPAVTASNIAAT